MKYYVNDKTINIPNNKKEFDHGSEGKVYLIDNSIYKIYYPSELNSNKISSHKYLIGIKTKQIMLPSDLIFDEDGNVVGYKINYANGSKTLKTGITTIKKERLLSNLRVLETDIKTLSNNFVLMADINSINYIYNQEKEEMYLIDPGRYKHTFYNKENCYLENMLQFKDLIMQLIYIDFLKEKPLNSKKKLQLLRDLIKDKSKNSLMSEYFRDNLNDSSDINNYAKSLGKYIK